MSAVRMCDRCGNIFAEGSEGSGVFAGSKMIRNDRTGRMESISTQMDVCGNCNGFQDPPTPRLGALSTKAHIDGDATGGAERR